jgi:hypothetical protein
MPYGPTSQAAFNRLLYNQQLLHLYSEGTHLATRAHFIGESRLYHFPANFFAEVFFSTFVGMVTHFNTFTEGPELASWAGLIKLPAGLLPNS